MRKILVYNSEGDCQVERFFLKADSKIVKKLKMQLLHFKDECNTFTEPYIKHFSIKKYRLFYELRIKASGTMVRIIFVENEGEMLLLYAFYKRDRKDTQKALETALRIISNITDETGCINKSCKKELDLK